MTGETFITDEGRQKVNDKFAPFTVDMETASIAHVYNVNRIPMPAGECVILKKTAPKPQGLQRILQWIY